VHFHANVLKYAIDPIAYPCVAPSYTVGSKRQTGFTIFDHDPVVAFVQIYTAPLLAIIQRLLSSNPCEELFADVGAAVASRFENTVTCTQVAEDVVDAVHL
jgi:hypothetical protein